MAEEAFLFEVGRSDLPSRLTVFASGANEAREIRGFQLAGVPVGVAVSHLREQAIIELLHSTHPVFADSGAFSEVGVVNNKLVVVAPITHLEWLRRLATYMRLARGLGPRLSTVAPDPVGKQLVTLERLKRYKLELNEIARHNAQIVIPIQNGDLQPAAFFERAQSITGLDLMPAFPMKKAATHLVEIMVSFAKIAICHQIKRMKVHSMWLESM